MNRLVLLSKNYFNILLILCYDLLLLHTSINITDKSQMYLTYYHVDGYMIYFCIGIHMQTNKKLLNFKIFSISKYAVA
jgi:hypothetical protein